jgi:hypothetical protein
MKLQQKLAVERIPDRLRAAGEPVELPAQPDR